MQLGALLFAQRLEEIRLELAGKRPQRAERPLPLRRDVDEMPAAILRIALPLDKAPLLELVEQADELATVIAERVGDRALGLV